MPKNLEEFIEIDASPAAVWAIASDLTRMPEWSPQTRKTIIRGGPIGEGSLMINLNRSGIKVWPTRSKVVAFEPEQRIAWKIRENHAIWSFELESMDDGTRTKLIERRDVSGDTTKLSKTLIDKFMSGETAFEQDLAIGMRQTLQRIRRAAESAS
ncbi:SRPBCC family protein [Flexivirga caeni]|uniref:SRPBCC family protein n=1 Tax=Flexivirga caeni TaxID=2294115 RepID=A0A3M9MIF8_9MICO|nr:SRPBCC family protein [Flexivirga caeni]